MRKRITDYLKENCQRVKSWHQPFTASATTKKPYGVIVLAEHYPSGRVSQAAFQEMKIWLYFEKGSFVALDAAVEELKELLADKEIEVDGGRMLVRYESTTRDSFDDERDANFKRISFIIPSNL